MYRLGLAALFAVGVGPLPAVSPDPKALAVPAGATVRAKELIRTLGSESYPDREAAYHDLAGMGRLASPRVGEAVARAADAEVLARCRRLLPKALDDEREAGRRLSGRRGRPVRARLPGLDRVPGRRRRRRGGPRAVRRDAPGPDERRAAAALAAAPADLGPRLAERRQEVWHWKNPRTPTAVRRDASLADLAVLVLAEIEAAGADGVRASRSASSSATRRPARPRRGRAGRRSSGSSPAGSIRAAGVAALSQALHVAARLELAAGGRAAARLLDTPGANGHAHASAAMTIARLGTRDQRRHWRRTSPTRRP